MPDHRAKLRSACEPCDSSHPTQMPHYVMMQPLDCNLSGKRGFCTEAAPSLSTPRSQRSWDACIQHLHCCTRWQARRNSFDELGCSKTLFSTITLVSVIQLRPMQTTAHVASGSVDVATDHLRRVGPTATAQGLDFIRISISACSKALKLL